MKICAVVLKSAKLSAKNLLKDFKCFFACILIIISVQMLADLFELNVVICSCPLTGNIHVCDAYTLVLPFSNLTDTSGIKKNVVE